MFKFFSSIAGLIATIVAFVGQTIDTVVAVFGMVGKTISFAFKYITSLPTIVSSIALLFISYCIVVNLLNKGS